MTTKTNFSFGMSLKSNLSYFNYLKNGLTIISPHLEIRSYKLAPKEKYPTFEKGKDVYVRVFWKKDPIYDFVAEHSFIFQLNTNKDDKKYMRLFANQKLEVFKDALERGKKKNKK